jgi:hypothetical protein
MNTSPHPLRSIDFVGTSGCCLVGVQMDNEYLKQQADRCRSLAEKADEFTKRRLLDLAAKYDRLAHVLRFQRGGGAASHLAPPDLSIS